MPVLKHSPFESIANVLFTIDVEDFPVVHVNGLGSFSASFAALVYAYFLLFEFHRVEVNCLTRR